MIVDDEMADCSVMALEQGELCSIISGLIRHSDGFILMYSIRDRASMDQISVLHDIIVRSNGYEYVPCVIVENQIDLEDEREMAMSEGTALAEELGCPFFRCSVKRRINVDEPIHALIQQMRSDISPQPIRRKPKQSKCTQM